MPVSVAERDGKFRIVGPDGKIEVTPEGHARDGGGHATHEEAARQQRAINMHLAEKARKAVLDVATTLKGSKRMNGWIGVDLDGTLAIYDGWRGPGHIGEPIPLMLDRVREWLAAGQEVRIVTARASIKEQIPPIERWLEEHGIGGLKVTNEKDFGMHELWDDRAVQVIPNTGRRADGGK